MDLDHCFNLQRRTYCQIPYHFSIAVEKSKIQMLYQRKLKSHLHFMFKWQVFKGLLHLLRCCGHLPPHPWRKCESQCLLRIYDPPHCLKGYIHWDNIAAEYRFVGKWQQYCETSSGLSATDPDPMHAPTHCTVSAAHISCCRPADSH